MYNDKYVLSQQIVQILIKCHILQHFILVFTVCLNLIIIAKPKNIHLIWCARLLSPVCGLYLFYVYLYWNKLYVLRLWINTFSPYPQFLFFPPQIYLKIKKWEKQEYTIRLPHHKTCARRVLSLGPVVNILAIFSNANIANILQKKIRE